MIRKLVLLSIAAVTIGAAGPAKADFYRSELILNPSSVVLPLAPGTAGTFSFNAGTIINVSTGYLISLAPMLAFGIYPSVTYAELGTGSTTLFSVVGGPTLNIPINGDDIHDAFFLTGAAGVTIVASTTNFTVRGELGKRFRIFDHVTWRPSFGALFVGSTDPALIINLLGMSLVW